MKGVANLDKILRDELRKYQKEISRKATNILKDYKFVYLAMEVRTGKTLTSLA